MRRKMMRSFPIVAVLSVVVATGLAFFVYHVSASGQRLQTANSAAEGSSPTATVAPPPGAAPVRSPAAFDPVPSQGTPITGAAAIASIEKGVTNPTGSYAKVTTWGVYFGNSNPGATVPSTAALTSARPVVVAAVTGNIDCGCSVTPLQPFAWKMVAFDQATGAMLNYWYGRGALPSWYTQLPDAG